MSPEEMDDVREPRPRRDSARDLRGTLGGLLDDIIGDRMSREEGTRLLRVLGRVQRLLRVLDLETVASSKEREREADVRVVELIMAIAGLVYAGFLMYASSLC